MNLMQLISAGEFPTQLADDVAQELLTVEQILEKYEINETQLEVLNRTPQFKRLVIEAKERWSSDTSTEERIRAKSSMLVEDSLLEIYQILHDLETGNAVKLEAFKQLTTVANLGSKSGTVVSGQKTTITINVPALRGKEKEAINITGDTIEE